jgi:hypothetical protein
MNAKKAAGRMPAAFVVATGLAASGLLDLGFLELDMLAHDRVILREAQLLGLGARVLLGGVEEAGVRRADELDLDRGRLCHDLNSCDLKNAKAANVSAALKRCPMAERACNVKHDGRFATV